MKDSEDRSATLYILELEYKPMDGIGSPESTVSTIRKFKLDLMGLDSCYMWVEVVFIIRRKILYFYNKFNYMSGNHRNSLY